MCSLFLISIDKLTEMLMLVCASIMLNLVTLRYVLRTNAHTFVISGVHVIHATHATTCTEYSVEHVIHFDLNNNICRELSEERELLDDSVGENRYLSRKLGRIERTLDRVDHERNSVSFQSLSNKCAH